MAAKRSDTDASKGSASPRIVNRRALHDYHIQEKLEVGIVLKGSEVKSIRNGQVSLAEGYARVEPETMELFLHQVDIAPYPQAGANQHEPKRTRKLLAHKRQIAHLLGATTGKGVTLIPLAMYFVRGKVKVELGLAVGKKAYDKRQDIKKREAQREIRRGMTRKVI
ncbi:MAG TPA: SsrA-binding protein SmpB [Phycisphaeraceae bacterium]